MASTKEITIYTSPNCPYCDAAKLLLDWNEFHYMEMESTTLSRQRDEDGVLFHDKPLPIIFIDGEYIGCYQQLVELIAQGKF